MPRRARRGHRRYASRLRRSAPRRRPRIPSRPAPAALSDPTARRYLPRRPVSTTNSHSWWTEKRGPVQPAPARAPTAPEPARHDGHPNSPPTSSASTNATSAHTINIGVPPPASKRALPTRRQENDGRALGAFTNARSLPSPRPRRTAPSPPTVPKLSGAQHAALRRSTSTWCRSAVNRASLSVAATRRTRPSSLSAPCPALSPGRVSPAAFPLAGRLPSTTSAAPPWALFGSFAGSTRPSDFSRSSITGLRPWPSPHDPPLHHDRRVTVRSPGSQHGEITHMPGSQTPRVR